jgi:CRP-like cAMP-binding protein
MPDLDVNEMAKVSRLFEALDSAGRRRLLDLAGKRHAAAGEVICREGDKGGEFFVISSGEVRVTCDSLDGEKEVARLTHGAFFGEMAALNGDHRSATCTAVSASELIVFPYAAAAQVLSEYPGARELLVKTSVLRSERMLEKMME